MYSRFPHSACVGGVVDGGGGLIASRGKCLLGFRRTQRSEDLVKATERAVLEKIFNRALLDQIMGWRVVRVLQLLSVAQPFRHLIGGR